MATEHRFGGSWTQEKLNRLEKYLSAYMNIFKTNPYARRYTTHYVDAFAGTGFRSSKHVAVGLKLFDDPEADEFQRGSVTVALESKPYFNHYLFVDSNAEHIDALTDIKITHPSQNIEIVQDDANNFLPVWCQSMNWNDNRAVVFLDPYGAQVDWVTIECMARTQAIDLWLLFPLGQAVNRMLTKHEPDPSWAARLDRLFGIGSWRKEFYRPSTQGSLFGTENSPEKVADFDAIGEFFVKRLQTVFFEVSKKPLALMNSKNIPIYLLCFASANPKGAKTAIKIANHILRR